MINKMNCIETINKILAILETSPEFFLVERECQESWNEDGVCFMIYLMEEAYRDYDALISDVIDEIVKRLGSEVTVLYDGYDCVYPQLGYALKIHQKNGGLAFEFEFHRVENGRPVIKN